MSQPLNQLFTPVPVLQAQRTVLVVPAFSIAAPTWTGVSRLVGEFPLSNGSRRVSLVLPIPVFDPSFTAAVRFVATRGIAQRFVLWQDPNAVLFYPFYNGETLGYNATLEIWSNSISSGYCTNSTSQQLPTSWMNMTQGCIIACTTDPVVYQPLIQVLPLTLPANAYYNPFCSCLVVN